MLHKNLFNHPCGHSNPSFLSFLQTFKIKFGLVRVENSGRFWEILTFLALAAMVSCCSCSFSEVYIFHNHSQPGSFEMKTREFDLKKIAASIDEVQNVYHFNFKEIRRPEVTENKFGTRMIFHLGDLELCVFKSTAAGVNGRYVPCTIKKDRKIVWSFRMDEYEEGSSKVAFLLSHEGDFDLIAVTEGSKILKVIPLDDLEYCRVVEKGLKGVHEIIGGRSISELLCLKYQVAISLNFAVQLTSEEKELPSDLQESAHAAAQWDIAAKTRRVKEILSRKKIWAFRTSDVKPVSGYPATCYEWRCLPGGTPVILVAKYQMGLHERSLEAFFVERKGFVAPFKRNKCPVSSKKNRNFVN